MDIEVIVATDYCRGFAKNLDIPWNISWDMKHFKRITTSTNGSKVNAVIMGRKTYEQMSRLLPDRINIIVTTNKEYTIIDNRNIEHYICHSYTDAINLCNSLHNIGKIFIIGGRKLYSESIEKRDVKYIHKTVVHGDFKCDTKFPEVPSEYKLVIKSDNIVEGNYTFHTELWSLDLNN